MVLAPDAAAAARSNSPDQGGIAEEAGFAAGLTASQEARMRAAPRRSSCVKSQSPWVSSGSGGATLDALGGKLAFTREGAHSRNRVLHAHGDSTGREIARTLYRKAASLPGV